MNRLHEYFITVFLAFVVQVMQEIGGMFFFCEKGGHVLHIKIDPDDMWPGK
jgi:hypothetical protein